MSESSWINKYASLLFLGFSFSFSWPLFQFNLNAEEPLSSVALITTFVLGTLGPGLAAVLVTYLMDGRAGVGKLLAGLVNWRISAKWLIFAAVMPALVIFLAVVVLMVTNGLSLDSISWYRWLTIIPNLILTMFIFGSISEELGWRGFFLPRLQSRYSAFVASIIVGVFWALWQMPNYLLNNPGGSGNLVWIVLEFIALAIIFTWLYNTTKSLTVTLIFNTVYKSVVPLLSPALQISDNVVPFQNLTATIMINFALLLLVFCGAKNLVFKRPIRQTNKE